MAEKPLLWVEVGARAVREKPGCNGVVQSGQALDKYKQRKREEISGFIFKAKSLSQKSNAGRRKKRAKNGVTSHGSGR